MSRPVGSKNSFSKLLCRNGHPRTMLVLRPNGDLRCMGCERAEKRRRRYGVTETQFVDMFEAQGRRCAACKTTVTDGRDWCLDHSHRTTKNRGILCHSCNRALGNVKDSMEILQALIDYLKRTEYGTEQCTNSGYDKLG
jgi:hypothetical protein